MTDSPVDAASNVIHLLSYYSFDLGGKSIERLIDEWLRHYPAPWLRLATIEALYQGRYKAISVEQILALWKRRGKPLQHFNREFEVIVCRQFSSKTAKPSDWRGAIAQSSENQSLENQMFDPLLAPGFDRIAPGSIDAEDSDGSDAAAIDSDASKPHFSASGKAEPVIVDGIKPKPSLFTSRSFLSRHLDPNSTNAETETETKLHSSTAPISPSSRLASASSPASPTHSPWTDWQLAIDPPFDLAVTHRISIQTFQPVADPSLDAFSTARSAHLNGSNRQPIHQFIPFPETSEFYAKLKFLAQHPKNSSTKPNLSKNQSNSES